MNVRKIELSLARDYAPSWGVWEGVREIIQNTLDAEGEVEFLDTGISFNTYMGGLSLDKLLLGAGTKAGDTSKVGGHGEGLKVAMLALVRAGVSVWIRDRINRKVLKPVIETSHTFGVDCLHVIASDGIPDTFFSGCPDLFIGIGKINSESMELIKTNYLYSGKYKDYVLHETKQGTILGLPELKGKVFVNGLYVTSISDLAYGYDFKPEYLQLDRDRKAVDSFDIKWITKDMWSQVTHKAGLTAQTVSQMVYDKVADTAFLNHARTKELTEGCVELYLQMHPQQVLASEFDDIEKLNTQGYTDVVYLGNDNFTKIVKASREYQSINFNKLEVKSNKSILEDFKDKWYDEFSTDCLISLEEIINIIKD